MHADLSRLPFSFSDARTHPFLRVVSQQGRVLLDADVNTQTDLLVYRMQMLTYGLLGPVAAVGNAFRISPAANAAADFGISGGQLWSFGVLCEGHASVTYGTQPDYPTPPALDPAKEYLVYLDVWERDLNSLEAPEIREVALGGPDTTGRTRVVWQVKALELGPTDWRPGLLKAAGNRKPTAAPAPAFQAPAGAVFHPMLADAALAPGAAATQSTPCDQAFFALLSKLPERFLRPLLEAGLEHPPAAPDPCAIAPGSRYRGLENQLYRVEVHAGGTAAQATFKWSRENGSVVFGVADVTTDAAAGTTTVALDDLGRDRTRTLQVGDWVELLNDARILGQETHDLLRVKELQPDDQSVVLEGVSDSFDASAAQHPYLRRWDHGGLPADRRGGAVPVQESPDAATGPWLALEDGIQVRFQAAASQAPARIYRPGDFWLIPARTLTGAIEWPYTDPQPPRFGLGYPVPLAYLVKNAAGAAGWQVLDVRKLLQPVTTCAFTQSQG